MKNIWLNSLLCGCLASASGLTTLAREANGIRRPLYKGQTEHLAFMGDLLRVLQGSISTRKFWEEKRLSPSFSYDLTEFSVAAAEAAPLALLLRSLDTPPSSEPDQEIPEKTLININFIDLLSHLPLDKQTAQNPHSASARTLYASSKISDFIIKNARSSWHSDKNTIIELFRRGVYIPAEFIPLAEEKLAEIEKTPSLTGQAQCRVFANFLEQACILFYTNFAAANFQPLSAQQLELVKQEITNLRIEDLDFDKELEADAFHAQLAAVLISNYPGQLR